MSVKASKTRVCLMSLRGIQGCRSLTVLRNSLARTVHATATLRNVLTLRSYEVLCRMGHRRPSALRATGASSDMSRARCTKPKALPETIAARSFAGRKNSGGGTETAVAERRHSPLKARSSSHSAMPKRRNLVCEAIRWPCPPPPKIWLRRENTTHPPEDEQADEVFGAQLRGRPVHV